MALPQDEALKCLCNPAQKEPGNNLDRKQVIGTLIMEPLFADSAPQCGDTPCDTPEALTKAASAKPMRKDSQPQICQYALLEDHLKTKICCALPFLGT